MKRIALLSVLILGGCMSQDYKSYENYIHYKRLPAPTVQQFPHCYGYGCPSHYLVELNDRNWKDIEKIFKPRPKTAEQERRRIEIAIGRFETIVGKLTGTDKDVGDTFKQTGDGQLDCVDESTNTSIYLDLLRQKGLLRFHAIEQPQIRLPFSGGGYWIHQTAVIRDLKTGQQYAVDSWFDDNGHPAYVVPFNEWKYGWKPEHLR
jgi:hypothetical protein